MRALKDFVPVFGWLPAYRRADLGGDLNAGLITGIMLVPQSMAYALLAGLPPEMGLYSSVFPLILYATFGTSRALAVGPVALVSLMVASTVNNMTAAFPDRIGEIPTVLALLVGAISVALGLLRVGFVVNFISHHVISGFTSAAALVIAFSQLKYLLGIDLPRTQNVLEILKLATERLSDLNPVGLTIGLASIGVLLLFTFRLTPFLRRVDIGEGVAEIAGKTGPLVVVLGTTTLVFGLNLAESADVSVVGDLPRGLPPLTAPTFDPALWKALAGPALLISFIGFLESVSVAKALASRRRQKIDANQELAALGMANIAATFSGGYPVAGGFGRSSVNFSAGAKTPLASLITAGIVALTALFLTPLFYFLPKAVLAAIIIVAVLGLVDIRTVKGSWHYSKADTLALAATFVSVFWVGVEMAIVIGVGISILMHLCRASRPHVAVVGRVPGTEHFRNYKRHEVRLSPKVTAVRVDETLFFANAAWFETWVLSHIADNPEAEHLVLICAAINYIDGTALETLERLEEELHNANVTLHLAEVKGPVMDRLQAAGFDRHMGPDRLHISAHAAMEALGLPM